MYKSRSPRRSIRSRRSRRSPKTLKTSRSRRSPRSPRRSRRSRRSPKTPKTSRSRRSLKTQRSRRSPRRSRSPKTTRRSRSPKTQRSRRSRRSPKTQRSRRSRRSLKTPRRSRSPKTTRSRRLLEKNKVPYKGKKWIILKSDKDIVKNIEKINWNSKYKYNIIDKGVHLKKLNPAYKYNNLKTFEGNIDDIDEFVEINKNNKSLIRQLNYLEEFRNDIRELIKDDLEYVYGVHHINGSIDFIATNEDGSICYIRSVDLGGYNKLIINGIKLNLLSWFSMTKEDKNKFFK